MGRREMFGVWGAGDPRTPPTLMGRRVRPPQNNITANVLAECHSRREKKNSVVVLYCGKLIPEASKHVHRIAQGAAMRPWESR